MTAPAVPVTAWISPWHNGFACLWLNPITLHCYLPGFSTRSWFGCSHIADAQTYCSADVPMPNPFTLPYTPLSEIQHHMHLNKLFFNVSKPDLLVAHTPSALKNCCMPSVSQAVQKVEVQFDSTLSFDQCVSHIREVFFRVLNLLKMQTFLSPFLSFPSQGTQQQPLWLMYLSAYIFAIWLLSLKLLHADISSSKARLQHKPQFNTSKHARANELWLLTGYAHFWTTSFWKISLF